jgi:hypothetical protein
MTELTKSEDKIHEFTIKRGHLLALHQNIRIILDNDIPSDQESVGLLLEILTDIAKQDKDTKKEFTLKLKRKQMKPAWHCSRIVLDNRLEKDHIHAEETMYLMALMAKEIDAADALDRPVLQLLDGGK